MNDYCYVYKKKFCSALWNKFGQVVLEIAHVKIYLPVQNVGEWACMENTLRNMALRTTWLLPISCDYKRHDEDE